MFTDRTKMWLLGLVCLMPILSLAYRVADYDLKENAECPFGQGFRSHCRGILHCDTLDAHLEYTDLKLNDVKRCGSTVYEELVCCPDKKPKLGVTKRPILTPAVVLAPLSLEQFGHLVSLRYYKDQHMDKSKYSCTGILIAPRKVITTAACVGVRPWEKPHHVQVGLIKSRQQRIECNTSPKIHDNDLVIITLLSNYDSSRVPDVKVASICSREEIDQNQKLFAVAFAQQSRENCGLFTQNLAPLKLTNCSFITKNKPAIISNLEDSQTHCCLLPLMDTINTEDAACTKCLRGSASVLHVERMDGSICVAGIATPTSNECLETKLPLYYTSLWDEKVQPFMEGKHSKKSANPNQGN